MAVETNADEDITSGTKAVKINIVSYDMEAYHEEEWKKEAYQEALNIIFLKITLFLVSGVCFMFLFVYI